MPKKEYGEQSISQLKGADRVRKRPAVIFGSDGLEGCEHSAFEILSNSVDEAREGYGSLIHVRAYNDGSIEVEDFGRGVPLDYNEKEGRYNWELVFCELYAGGKYDNNSGAAAYKYSLGTNGLGACATQYSSEYMYVRSCNGGFLYEINFKKGEPDGELKKTPLTKKKSGTLIRWKPDLEVFTDIAIPKEFYTDVLKKQSVVNSGIKFSFHWQREDGSFEDYEYLYENGISDYVRELAGESSLTEPVFWKGETKGRDRDDKEDYELKMEVSFCASNTVNVIEYYHNSSFLKHGGSPDKAVRTAFVYSVDKYLKNQGKYNKNESKVTFGDIEDCLVLVTNSFSTESSYANQTKMAVTNTFIADAMTEFLKNSLEIYFIEKPKEAEKICAQALINKRSRENAESTRLDIKKKLSGKIDLTNRIEKFVNCRSKDKNERELYIVEGDSACTSCRLARDSSFQAIMPVRGKTLNCLKSPEHKIFKSDIIVDLLKIFGCGVEIKTKNKNDAMPFDMEALRWSKIIICTDADEDGFQIRTLLLTMFYRLLPSLIEAGKVFIAETPLFEIRYKQKGEEKIRFAYDEREKVQILKEIGDVKYSLQRSKGLGENDAEMMSLTTMSPSTRRLIQVSPADAEQTAYIFETLLGDDLTERKDFIAKNGYKYVADADV